MNAEVTISAEHVCRTFGPITALSDVTLSVHRGEVFGFLGPNGSGKSTLIRILCGVLEPNSGEARVLNYDCTRQSERVKQVIGYVPQRFSLYSDLTVQENLEFFGNLYGLKGRPFRKRMDEIGKWLSLSPYLRQITGSLSGGWKMRLSLACGLLHDPPVLFLDEPTAGIDPVARAEIWNILFELSGQGKTLFITTHSMDEAERCGRLGYIYFSRLLALGPPEQLTQMAGITPPGTRWADFHLAGASEKLHILRRMEGILRATVYGNTVHMLVRSELDDASLNQQLYQNLGLEVFVLPSRATVEDVFIALTSSQERST